MAEREGAPATGGGDDEELETYYQLLKEHLERWQTDCGSTTKQMQVFQDIGATYATYLDLATSQTEQSKQGGDSLWAEQIKQIEADVDSGRTDASSFDQTTLRPFIEYCAKKKFGPDYIEPARNELRLVLMAYAQRNRRPGYVQGMNMVTALLLCGLPPEAAFWMLSTIVEDLRWRDFYSHAISNMHGFQVECAVLEAVIAKQFPIMMEVMDKEHVSMMVTLFCAKSLIPMFVNRLNLPTTIEVWDHFFSAGSLLNEFALMNAALAFISLLNDEFTKQHLNQSKSNLNLERSGSNLNNNNNNTSSNNTNNNNNNNSNTNKNQNQNQLSPPADTRDLMSDRDRSRSKERGGGGGGGGNAQTAGTANTEKKNRGPKLFNKMKMGKMAPSPEMKEFFNNVKQKTKNTLQSTITQTQLIRSAMRDQFDQLAARAREAGSRAEPLSGSHGEMMEEELDGYAMLIDLVQQVKPEVVKQKLKQQQKDINVQTWRRLAERIRWEKARLWSRDCKRAELHEQTRALFADEELQAMGGAFSGLPDTSAMPTVNPNLWATGEVELGEVLTFDQFYRFIQLSQLDGGFFFPGSVVERVVGYFDHDNSGYIDFKEFLAFLVEWVRGGVKSRVLLTFEVFATHMRAGQQVVHHGLLDNKHTTLLCDAVLNSLVRIKISSGNSSSPTTPSSSSGNKHTAVPTSPTSQKATTIFAELGVPIPALEQADRMRRAYTLHQEPVNKPKSALDKMKDLIQEQINKAKDQSDSTLVQGMKSDEMMEPSPEEEAENRVQVGNMPLSARLQYGCLALQEHTVEQLVVHAKHRLEMLLSNDQTLVSMGEWHKCILGDPILTTIFATAWGASESHSQSRRQGAIGKICSWLGMARIPGGTPEEELAVIEALEKIEWPSYLPKPLLSANCCGDCSIL